VTTVSDALERDPSLPDPTAPLTATGNLRRRGAVSRFIELVASAAALFAVAMLGLVIYEVAKQGLSAVTSSFPDFLFTNPSGLAGGGILNSLLGTAVIVALAAVIAVPIGVLTGLYLTEFAGSRARSARGLKLVLDLMQGLPTIIAGVFIYALLVATTHIESGLAGSLALSIVMLPLIARSSQEVLLLVPNSLREAADALGVERWRTVLGVILPAAIGGIATGAILSIARAAGETAPLLFVNSIYDPGATQLNLFGHGVPSIPIFIYTNYDLPSQEAVSRVWGAAFVLLVCILLANVGARVLLARTRAKMRS
jgi:phosphate transport system permease protein